MCDRWAHLCLHKLKELYLYENKLGRFKHSNHYQPQEAWPLYRTPGLGRRWALLPDSGPDVSARQWVRVPSHVEREHRKHRRVLGKQLDKEKLSKEIGSRSKKKASERLVTFESRKLARLGIDAKQLEELQVKDLHCWVEVKSVDLSGTRWSRAPKGEPHPVEHEIDIPAIGVEQSHTYT